jgi:NADH-quinone oxidoreductase subunit A
LVTGYAGALALLGLAVAAVSLLYLVSLSASLARDPLRAAPWSGGELPGEHPLSRFHARYYAMTVVFLAFDLEMLFMYPWAVVVADMGGAAVLEMFGFLAVLVFGVLYAWREGAFRWS